MMKLNFLMCLFMVQFTIAQSQDKMLPLWGKHIPNHQKSDEVEIYPERDIFWIEKIQTPELEIFLPNKRQMTGKAVVICPGGGYHGLAYDFEGSDVAKWYNSKGIAAFVLKYRMPNSASVKVSYEAPLQDAQRAIRLVRYHADQWGINKNDVGIMGFSAGGHLASTLGTQYDTKNNFKESEIDKISARPDFMILMYPVITMKNEYTHQGSKNSLLGKNPTEELVVQFSNEAQVTENTPPTFIVHAGDDTVVPVENSLQMYQSLKNHGVLTEMHIYPKGGHGFGLAVGRGSLQSWTDNLYEWLQ